MIRSVAIVGGGFSGSLLAISLLRHRPDLSVRLIERRHGFGRGVAYSASNPGHLLNVRAANMSALPDAPTHFADWLRARGDDTAFARRGDYGLYLSELLRDSATRHDRLELIAATATDARAGPDGVAVTLDHGRTLLAHALVLATGNLAPTPPGIDVAGLPPGVWIGDAWAAPIDTAADADASPTLLLGTGLTMVDVALASCGRVVAMSRRGLLPRAHADAHADAPQSAIAPLTTRPHGTLAQLLRQTRARAEARGWRAAIDELRPFTQSLWAAASPERCAQFLRHLRPWWVVHRHRIAPEVEARLRAMLDSGRLRVMAGRPTSLRADGDGVTVNWRPRGATETRALRVRRIVNCVGPSGDVAASGDPLLLSLLRAGVARADPFRLGLDVDAGSRLIGRDGRVAERLFALGPLTRGAFWEITAVPDI